MADDDLIAGWRSRFDAPEASDEEVVDEVRRRFLLVSSENRKLLVDQLEKAMLEDDIDMRLRANRHCLHREFFELHQNLKHLGR